MNKLNKQLISKMEYLSGKMENVTTVDTKVLQEIIAEGIGSSITQVVAAQQKNVI